MRCPKCPGPLETLHIGEGLAADSCPSCHGAFFARDALRPRVKVYGLKPTPLPCPKCGEPLHQGDVWDGKLQLDECRACGGIWFDAGELARLRKLTQPDAREWVEAAAALPTGPKTWIEIGRLLRDWVILLLILAGTGPAHRAWVKRYSAERAIEESRIQEARRQAEGVRQAIARLPPETRKIVLETVKDMTGEVHATPLMVYLSGQRSNRGAGESWEQSRLAAERIVRFEVILARSIRALAKLLWLVLAVAVGAAFAGFIAARPAWLDRVAGAAGSAAGIWCRIIALGCAGGFTLTGLNPWRGLPPVFTLAPAILALLHAALSWRALKAGEVVRDGVVLVQPAVASAVVTTVLAAII